MEQVQRMTTPTADEIRRRVARGKSTWVRWAALVAVLLAGAAGVAVWTTPRDVAVAYRLDTIERGDIVTRAAATGTLEPTRIVTVGAEISGRIASVEVEDNDTVEAGQVLAVFDTTSLESQLQLARARVASSSASIRGAQANFDAAVTEHRRVRQLVDRGVLARAELDSIAATELRARSDLDRARAESQQSRASVEEMELQLKKAVILSPIDGVIMSRNVEPGQTVASSLQAPELFVVAEDLSQMRLDVWVDEADVGVVAPGQEATFEVAAWPNKTFHAVVEKLDLSPTTTENVVTYAAVLSVDNPEGLLRPGMTANATIVTGKREDVLRVPNSALRWRPPADDEAQAGSPLLPTGRWRGRRNDRSNEDGGTVGTVYVSRAGEPVEMRIQTGRSDGRFTEVVGGELKEGDQVITGIDEVSPDGGRGGRS